MPRPPKRARSCSDAPSNDEAAAQVDVPDETIDVPNPGPERHSTLWYEDGNVVLSTNSYLYRVHKSILSRQSTMFKDMFQVSGDAEGDSKGGVGLKPVEYEGVPLVALSDDSDEDVFSFLSTLYDRNFFRMHERTTLSILISLSRMSTKYNALEIRSELVNHLAQIYPDNLLAYENSKKNEMFDAPPPDLDFHLLSVARECDARILLPALFYACASQPLSLILDSSEIIEKDDYNTILLGREKMMKYAYEIATMALLPGKKCRSTECAALRTSSITGHIDYGTHNPPPFTLHVSNDGVLPTDAAVRANLCSACVKNYRDSLRTNRQQFWRDLPSIFDLGKWSEIRQRVTET